MQKQVVQQQEQLNRLLTQSGEIEIAKVEARVQDQSDKDHLYKKLILLRDLQSLAMYTMMATDETCKMVIPFHSRFQLRDRRKLWLHKVLIFQILIRTGKLDKILEVFKE